MKFSEELNSYLKILNCSAQDLSKASGLSPTLVSRYLNDKRTPRVNSEYFAKLVDGIYLISVNNNVELNKKDIADVFNKSIYFNDINFDDFIINFNNLILELKINISDLANSIGYDTSFISKVRNKNRKPSDLNDFSQKVADYIVESYQNHETLCSLIKYSLEDVDNKDALKKSLTNWLITPHNSNNKLVSDFLTKLDKFDLNDYIGTDFSKVKVPTSPIILRTSKTYYGADGRKQAEGEFLKTTLISKAKEPIFFYNDLPMAEAGKDNDFKQKWVLAITMVLKKGLHLNIIHDIDRPINEMFLGLESWIPIYMTGSISPYYFKEHPSNMFLGSHCTSGSVALSGEYIKNNIQSSKFYLTTKKEELDYYKEKSSYLLSKAKPLMTIFKEADKEKFEEFMNNEGNFPDVKKIKKDIFSNIDFYVRKNKWVMVNKQTSPEIHFVIHNSKLRDAIEQFLL